MTKAHSNYVFLGSLHDVCCERGMENTMRVHFMTFVAFAAFAVVMACIAFVVFVVFMACIAVFMACIVITECIASVIQAFVVSFGFMSLRNFPGDV